MANNNNFWIHLLAALAHGLIWIVPFVFLAFPKLADLTLSGIGSIIVSYASTYLQSHNS